MNSCDFGSFHVCTCVSFSHTSFKNSFKKFQLLSSNPGVELAPEDPSHHVHITQTSAGHDMTWAMLVMVIRSGLGFIAVFCENVLCTPPHTYKVIYQNCINWDKIRKLHKLVLFHKEQNINKIKLNFQVGWMCLQVGWCFSKLGEYVSKLGENLYKSDKCVSKLDTSVSKLDNRVSQLGERV